MAWVTPYTDWSDGNMFTYEDWNRIAGNINYLYSAANIPTATHNDFLTKAMWTAAINALQTLIYATGLNADVPGSTMNAEAINAIEDLIQQLYDRIGLNLRQTVATAFAGDDIYAANAGQYTDIAENYTRGG